MQKYLFIAYPGCSTCRNARKWLEEHGVGFEERHIVEQRPVETELNDWIQKSGLPVEKFFNTNGSVYKALGLKDKLPGMSVGEKIRLLASDGKLVKRPLLIAPERVWAGFKPEDWVNGLPD